MHSATRGREPDRPDRSRPSPSLPKFPNRKIEGAQFSPFLPPVLQAPTTTGNCGIAWAGSLRIHDHKALTDSSCLAVCNPDHPDQSLSTKLAGAGLPQLCWSLTLWVVPITGSPPAQRGWAPCQASCECHRLHFRIQALDDANV